MLKIWRVIFVTTISLVAVLTAHSYLVLNSKTNSRALMRPGRDSLITHHAPKSRTLRMAFDIPIIPAIIGVSVGVFAIFNIENPVDLTDSGRAKAKAKRRAERLARGETIKPKEGLDPYRFRIFEEDDDDDIDIIGAGKKTGGCG